MQPANLPAAPAGSTMSCWGIGRFHAKARSREEAIRDRSLELDDRFHARSELLRRMADRVRLIHEVNLIPKR
jgi:hypothetical protein